MANIPTAQVAKILKESGAERMSAGAKDELKNCLHSYGAEVSARAVKLARHAGRKTVKDSDIKLALE